MNLEEATKALKEKLSTIPEVWNVETGENVIYVFATTMKVWVDIPPVFPKGPEGFRVDLICQKPSVSGRVTKNPREYQKK